MSGFLFVLSISPFVLFLLLLLWKKTSLLLASMSSLTLMVGLSVVFWQILPIYIFHSFTKGFLVAFDIFVIIFGAIFFLEILKSAKIVDSLCYYLKSFSQDYRVQVILLAWFLENFIEGTAGFGTPSAVVAPLLIGLGLSPITAVIIALLGNSTSVVFGAAGTPIRVGFADLNVSAVPLYAALINIFGFLVPVFMLWVLVSSQKDKKRQFREGLAFALWSGIAFVIPSAAIAFFGQEFPSILGAVVGIALVFLTTRLGFFLPPKTRSLQPTPPPETILPLSKVLFPYVFLIVLLVLGKLLLGSSSLSFTLGVRQTINLFNPGLAFILAGLWLAVVWNKKNLVSQTLRLSSQRAFEPFLVIAAISALGQLMINSGQNLSGFPSALTLIAQKFETPALPFWTPFIGAFGSFITGSATVSNIMFGSFLEFAGKVMGLATNKILSLALVGAAAGNMIALADILAAETVVGLKNREREVLKGVILPCLIYILLVGLVGIFIT